MRLNRHARLHNACSDKVGSSRLRKRDRYSQRINTILVRPDKGKHNTSVTFSIGINVDKRRFFTYLLAISLARYWNFLTLCSAGGAARGGRRGAGRLHASITGGTHAESATRAHIESPKGPFIE
ncbi:hypothetical protein EVAR_10778_1 [Eumeta japonica]|uniref:Uncharacterized protein n=1 Tax=Eumeta variegata TaxID=151549 RepID=A0A4C1W7F5_EUMVA|nr:hypothetical protein EVAR_10778_1 [Eumeta japonica]